MEELFNINVIDENTLQIYGKINGFATKRTLPREMNGSYSFSIRFILNKKLIKIANHYNDGTIRSVGKLKDRIQQIYNKEKEKEAMQ